MRKFALSKKQRIMKSQPNTYIKTYKNILRLGLPILIGQLGTIVVGFADNIMVGHYSTEALASASFVNNLFNCGLFACLGFTYGITPIVASLFSRKMDNEIGSTMRSAVKLNVAFSLAVTLIMTIFFLNVERMGQPEELIPIIKPYFMIYLAGVVPVSLFNVFAQWSYAVNNTRMPMWIILGANALNIIGNYMLIYGNCGMPEMGLTGAGVSTLTARLLSAGLMMGAFFGRKRYASYAKAFMRGVPVRGMARKLNRTSWPVAVQMGLESGSFTFAAIVAGWLGTIELASFQIIVIVGMLGFCLYYSVGSATSVLVANACGLNDTREMRRIAFGGYHVTIAIGTVSSLAFIFGGRFLISAFTTDPAVLAMTMTLIIPLVLYQLGDATQISFANALRGTSNVMPMLWIAFVSYVIIGAPATYLLAIPAGMGVTGIILSFSASLFFAGGCFAYFFFRTVKGGN
ncbi:MATE family efflux transporter [uncultured Duncaniella sp.]|uniref:MATE family efflux transporter n=1 Tax=uncultured Duncaniella sp. TaxID=2768039 RepID=UPI00266FB723|nr:MATE family efflux transporter [uncultured Duncaniella sp.]